MLFAIKNLSSRIVEPCEPWNITTVAPPKPE